MEPATIIALFNIIAPHAFRIIGSVIQDNPDVSYHDALERAGVQLDAEYEQLLIDMARAVSEGAVPRVPSGGGDGS